MPVTIVSNSDWLLTRGADTCGDDLGKELFVLGVGQELVQVPIRVEINDFGLALVHDTVLASAPTGTILPLRLYHSHSICTILFHRTLGGIARLLGGRHYPVLLLLHFFLEGHGLRARVKRYRLDGLAAFFGWGYFRRAVVLSNC